MIWFAGAAGILAALVAALALFSALYGAYAARLAPPEGRFVTVDGVRLHYVDKGAGPPIILIHGLAGNVRNFTHSLVDKLADQYRVIAVDRPGSGHSDRDLRGFTLSGQAGLIARLLETLEIDSAIVVGHSLGGAVALALALDHPARVRTLALIAPLTMVEAVPPAVFKRLFIASPRMRHFIASVIGVPFGISKAEQVLRAVFAPEPVPAGFATVGGGVLANRPKAIFTASTEVTEVGNQLTAQTDRYAKLRVPLFILFGRSDPVLDPMKHGGGAKVAVAGAELMIVAGGHMLPVTQPDLAASWIKSVSGSLTAG